MNTLQARCAEYLALAEKATKGPLSFYLNHRETMYFVVDSKDRIVCEMSWHDSVDTHYTLRPESEANAAFIAARDEGTALIRELAAENARLEADARRYRWLRIREAMDDLTIESLRPFGEDGHYHLTGDEADKAIDAAIQESSR